MQALKPTDHSAVITWLGRVRGSDDVLRSETIDSAYLHFTGIDEERHGGLTRPACVRTKQQYPVGTEIRNVRQLTVLSAEELAEIAAAIGVEAMDPVWMGASMVVEGIADFSHVPPSSRLQAPSGASIVIDMENRPCVLPGREMEKDRPGKGAAFKPAAEGRRGVTAWVECEGPIAVGDRLTLHIPDQPVWAGLADARS